MKKLNLTWNLRGLGKKLFATYVNFLFMKYISMKLCDNIDKSSS